jgi:hypothetical protein
MNMIVRAPINPFAAGAPDTVNALPPDVANIARLEALSLPLAALAIGLCAIVVVSIYVRRLYG